MTATEHLVWSFIIVMPFKLQSRDCMCRESHLLAYGHKSSLRMHSSFATIMMTTAHGPPGLRLQAALLDSLPCPPMAWAVCLEAHASPEASRRIFHATGEKIILEASWHVRCAATCCSASGQHLRASFLTCLCTAFLQDSECPLCHMPQQQTLMRTAKLGFKTNVGQSALLGDCLPGAEIWLPAG